MSTVYKLVQKTKRNKKEEAGENITGSSNENEFVNEMEWIPHFNSSRVTRPTNWGDMVEADFQLIGTEEFDRATANIRARLEAERAAEEAAAAAARQQAAAQLQAVRQAAQEAAAQRAAEAEAQAQQAAAREQARRQQQISAETGQMRAQLRQLNAKAAAAPLSVANPQPGDFKKNASGQLYVWKRPINASGRKGAAKWMPISRNTDYETDLQKYYSRIARIGKNYQSRRRNRRQSRKTRKQRK